MKIKKVIDLPDKFPEAFKDRFKKERFTELMSIKNDKSMNSGEKFRNIFLVFQDWGGKHAPMTQLQTDILRKSVYDEMKIGMYESRNKRGVVYRKDLESGKFVSSSDYESYQNDRR